MAAQKGREFILKVKDDTEYKLVGGFRTNSFTINGETIDVTNKGSVSQSASGYRELLPEAGVVSISTSGSGVFIDDGSFDLVHDKALNQQLVDCMIKVPGFKQYTGLFAITSLEMSGEHNGEITYSISLESAGEITPATYQAEAA